MPASASPRRALAALAAAALGGAFGILLDLQGPAPAADAAQGSEEAFAVRTDLHARELPPQAEPLRWTGHRVRFRFRHLPRGPAWLQIRLRDSRAPVVISCGGVVVGRLAAGQTTATLPLPDRPGSDLDVELRTRAFVAEDGRHLGVLLGRVALDIQPRGRGPTALVWLLVGASLVVFAAAAVSGLGASGSLVAAAVAAAATTALLWPMGIARSPYASELVMTLGLGAGLAAGFAALWRRSGVALRAAAFTAALAAVVAQGLTVTSPLFVMSDALFHANKLGAVATGDLFPTSVTQHDPPFRIPYGVSFYALLAPLLRESADAVPLARWGAAVAGIVGSLALFGVARPLGATAAALAVVLLQLLPGVLDIYSYGNLSNVFGQAVTVGFFAWWAGRAPGGWILGALLLATAGLGHLSSLIVLAVLVPALVVARRGQIRKQRARLWALAIGGALLVLYYAQFWPLVRDQLPRLLEGTAVASGPSSGVGNAVRRQLQGVLQQWGLPVVVLALLGCSRPRASGLERDLSAFWAAGAVLAVVAIVSPLEVRYLYALTVPLAVAAARGVGVLLERGHGPALVALALLAAQLWLALGGVAEALLHRYRP